MNVHSVDSVNEFAVIVAVCYVHSSVSPAQQMTLLLQQAKQYASSLLTSWSLSRCSDSLLIFYSRRDNVVSIVSMLDYLL